MTEMPRECDKPNMRPPCAQTSSIISIAARPPAVGDTPNEIGTPLDNARLRSRSKYSLRISGSGDWPAGSEVSWKMPVPRSLITDTRRHTSSHDASRDATGRLSDVSC